MTGKTPMKNWKSAIITWEENQRAYSNERQSNSKPQQKQYSFNKIDSHDYSDDEFDGMFEKFT